MLVMLQVVPLREQDAVQDGRRYASKRASCSALRLADDEVAR